MSYEVSIVADSSNSNGVRVTTFQLKYPRMIHAEFMTHREFSRNASSTRAIPTAKMIEWIKNDPAMPVYWGKNQKGMQAGEELTPREIARCKEVWLSAKDTAIAHATALMDCGVHKQIASRILEPWAHINVVCTATSYDNFFTLRCHQDAMPEIHKLAVLMARAYRRSKPVSLGLDDWHLPYVTEDDEDDEFLRLKYSVARCARVSYMTFDGKAPDPEKDLELHDQLQANGHWSPFEHQARPTLYKERFLGGNLKGGWIQYRQTLPVNVHKKFDFSKLDTDYADRDFIV